MEKYKNRIFYAFVITFIIVFTTFIQPIPANIKKDDSQNFFSDFIIEILTEIEICNITDSEIFGNLAFFNSSGPVKSKPTFRLDNLGQLYFRPAQILTEKDLNVLVFGFFDGQTRLTRTYTIGTGIIVGLSYNITTDE
jgi:hypothetical protein